MALYAPALVGRHVQILTAQEAVQIRASLLVGLLAPEGASAAVRDPALLPVKIIHVV